MWKRPAGKRCDYSWFQIRLSAPPHHPSSTEDSSTAKEKKLTNNASCLIGFPNKLQNISIEKQTKFTISILKNKQSSQYQYWKTNEVYNVSTEKQTKFTISVLKNKQSSQYQYWIARKYSILTVLNLDRLCRSPQLGHNSLCHHWFWTQTSKNENRKLATHRIQSRTQNHNTMFNH